MSAQQNQELVRRLFEDVWNKNDLNAAKEIIHDEYQSFENITFATLRGLQVLTADMNFYRDVYADLNFKIDNMFSHGDLVVTVWQASGTARHKFFSDRLDRPTNFRLEAEGVSLSKVADGKIIENKLLWPRDPLSP